MAQTAALVSARLPACLSAIVLGYFRATSRGPEDIAEAGEWEEVVGIGYSYGTFEGACLGQHVELIAYLLTLGTDEEPFNEHVDEYLATSVCYSKLEAVRALLDAGVVTGDDVLADACCYGNLDAARLAIGRGATDWNKGAAYACRMRHNELTDLMAQMGATGCACSSGWAGTSLCRKK